jgi:hypothetical protein
MMKSLAGAVRYMTTATVKLIPRTTVISGAVCSLATKWTVRMIVNVQVLI